VVLTWPSKMRDDLRPGGRFPDLELPDPASFLLFPDLSIHQVWNGYWFWGRPAGLVAAWPRGRKPLRTAVRMDRRVVDPAGPPAWV